ncbi:MAG: phosphoenolpyruvate--protein phosphotransferase [Ruminococcaceae bacterium]|nr:phosphoenolpyruvate--protein phosphotransferase [Oscillospiraceae bacterium]
MFVYYGKGVSGGIALGRVTVFEREHKQIRRDGVEDTTLEKRRFENAKSKAHDQLSKIYEKALREVGETNAEIFNIHMMMLEDDDYNESVIGIIEKQKVNAEYAVSVTGENFAMMFASMDDAYMRARQADVRDISSRLISCMSEENDDKTETENNSIVCAYDLAPSETVLLDKEKVLAFVTSRGSANSHTAILAGSMNIPAIISVGDELMQNVKDKDMMIVDGYSGRVIVNPDKKTLEKYEKKQNEDFVKKERLKRLKGKDNVTKDGRRINIYANIGAVENVGDVLLNDAGGIGLFRSEFLYLGKEDYPTEQQQFEAYKTVLESMAGKKVVIRTLDIGADKQADYFHLEKEENPALGFRGIRVCLEKTDIFKTQLRALYRASAFGNLAIMFPMITNDWEIDEILSMCDEVKRQLDDNGIPYGDNIEIGIMIETPAAAIISDILAPKVDFFSIGTNDLTQYTLACDRQNGQVGRFCDTHHKAILRLIEFATKNAHKNGAWIGICGELAQDTSLTETFIRMGVDELSVTPSNVLKVRQRVREMKIE